jgi:hypothetical protein
MLLVGVRWRRGVLVGMRGMGGDGWIGMETYWLMRGRTF